jgi:flagellar biosynthesis chaperone FliJ
MTGPYATVLRIRRREVDDYGVAIAGAREQLSLIEQAIAVRAEAIRHESRIGAADPLLSSHAYMSRLRRERTELKRVEAEADAALEALREQAAEAVASLRATEESADEHAREEGLALGRKEQAEFDDIAAARLLRARR